jgi:hypothetical protein
MKMEILSALQTGQLYPHANIPGYSLLLEVDSTQGPQCGQIDHVNEELQ